MIVVQHHFFVKDPFIDSVQRDLPRAFNNMSKFPGFMRARFMKPLMGRSIIMMTEWDTIEDFNQWNESEEFKKSVLRSVPDHAMESEPVVSMHEVYAP